MEVVEAGRTAKQWERQVQAVADFRYFVYYPTNMKARHKRKSAPRTIMHQREKKKAAFMKPRRSIFKRSEYKRAQKAGMHVPPGGNSSWSFFFDVS